MAKKPTYTELEQRVKELEKEVVESGRLEDRSRLLSLAIEQSSEGIAVVDMDGNLEYLNDAFAQMHGYSAEELIGKNLSIFHTPNEMPSVEAANRQLTESGEFKGEIWHVRRDGTIFPTLMHNSLVRDDAGKPIGMIGTIRDITHMKQAENALRETEKRARQYLDIAGVAFVALDREGDITLINQRGLEILGYQREELLGKNWFETCLPERFQKDVLDVYHQLIRGEVEPVEYYENPVLTKDGKERIIAWHNSVLRNPDGEIVGILSSGEDITDRLLGEETLRESEERYRSLFERSLELVYLCDFEGNFIDANDAALEGLGYTKKDIKSLNFMALLDKNELSGAFKAVEEILKTDSQKEVVEYKLRRKDGEHIYVESKGSLIYRDGKPFAVQGIARNITDRKLAEEALRESEEKYRSMMEAMKDPIYICS